MACRGTALLPLEFITVPVGSNGYKHDYILRVVTNLYQDDVLIGLPVHEGSYFHQLWLLSIVEEAIRVSNIEYIHFGKSNDARSLPVVEAQGTIH
jgi:hypothetical protein